MKIGGMVLVDMYFYVHVCVYIYIIFCHKCIH